MPIYEYACRGCGAETEIMHKISDPPVRKCPACGKLKLTKQVSAGGFRLTGGGWYETDFKKDGKRNIAGEKADSAPAAKPASADKSADKPVEKSADKGKSDKKEPVKKEAAKTEAKKPAKQA